VSASATLQEENRLLKQALVERDERIAELERAVVRMAELEKEIEALREQLRGAARDQARLEARLKELLARRRALAEELAPGQLALFGLEEEPKTPPCATEAPDGETKEDKIRPRHAPKRAPREISYEALAREHVQHELSPEERVCKVTGKALVPVGEKTTEELEYRAAKLVVVVHHRVQYGLREEDRAEWTIEPLWAPMPVRPIENALAGPGLLAWIQVQKYRHHLPLYRQQAIFAREGLFLPRQTLCDWTMGSAIHLAPIVLALKRLILASGVVQLDDTPVQCQGGKGAPNFEARLWAYLSPLVEGVVFDFVPDKTHEHVLAFLGESFRGYMVGDGYQGYGTVVSKQPGVIEAGCWAHYPEPFVIRSGGRSRQHALSIVHSGLRITTLQGGKEVDHVGRRPPALPRRRSEPRPSPEGLERLSLHLHVGADVPAGRRHAGVAEVVADDRDVDAGLQQRDSAAVA
jgi:transposase